MDIASHTYRASNREKVLEHLFVADLLRCLWCKGITEVEVLRAEVDAGGYDLVVECGGFLRHIQLKSSHKDAKTAKVDINLKLAKKPSGCAIWIKFDPETLQLGPFLWLGGPPGGKLPELEEKIARHTRGNAEGKKGTRPGMRVVAKGQFTMISSMDELIHRLFGKIVLSPV